MTDRAAYMADYYRTNRAELRARQRADRAKNQDRNRARSAAWRAQHPTRAAAGVAAWHAAHPEARSEANARWKAANRQAVALIEHARRARLAGLAVIPLTVELLAARRAFLGERCWICGTNENLQWDHVKPIARGGPHLLSNLKLACGTCNAIKNARWFSVYQLPVLVALVRERRIEAAA